MVARRGEIWWAALPDPRGSEPGYRRPVLVVQSDPFNESRIQTVIVAAVTSNTELARAPGNVLLGRRLTRLSKESVVNVSQILTLDRRFLRKRASKLPAPQMNLVDQGMRLALGL